MGVHIGDMASKNHWTIIPLLNISDIYKDSFLTDQMLGFLLDKKSATVLMEWLRTQIRIQTLTITDKIDGLIALIALGDFDTINTIIAENDSRFIECFGNRIEQLICSLKDPIARWATYISKYLLTVYEQMKGNQTKYEVYFINYCKVYLSLSAKSGGATVDIEALLEVVDDIEDKCYLYAEYWASKFTSASDGIPHILSRIFANYVGPGKGNEIIRSFFKINEATQIYKRPIVCVALGYFRFSMD